MLKLILSVVMCTTLLGCIDGQPSLQEPEVPENKIGTLGVGTNGVGIHIEDNICIGFDGSIGVCL